MDKIDRLSTLMARFHLTVRAASPEAATLLVLPGPDGAAGKLLLGTDPLARSLSGETPLFSAEVDWGGEENPLFLALPKVIELDVSGDPEMQNLLVLIEAEIHGDRCGAGSVVSRLAEVLVVRVLRRLIEAGSVESGLLAGLSDPRLSRSIVAIHDRPEAVWTNEDLASIAGLSLSRYIELFQRRVGQTPAAYLRRWRLSLASRELAGGARVERVAHRYGFRSPEGFTRAFKRQFGLHPAAYRKISGPGGAAH